MSILSIRFLCFLAAALIVYYLLPLKWRWVALLCANSIFYLSAGVKNAGFLVITAVSAWGGALVIGKVNEKYKVLRQACTTKEEKQKNRAECSQHKKRIMAVILILNFGLWLLLKYILKEAPLGISFYTFIAMGYCIDVYRGKYPAENNFARFFVFLAFFPQMVQGPFSRYDKMKDALFTGHSFDGQKLWEGAVRILWGFFKKMVVAEKLGYVTATIYGDWESFGGIYVVVLLIVPVLQLYADFSGYMDIACGMSRMFGIRLQENFRQPFFSRSVEEKWRRWHITLGDWFKDYIFYAISMSKWAQDLGRKCRQKMSPSTARMIPSYISFLVVWTFTGFWHGAALHFLLWGWMNLAVIAGSMQLAPVYGKVRKKLHIREDSRAFALFQMVRTFFLFGLMGIFSDAPSAQVAFSICASLGKLNWGLIKHPMLLLPGLNGWEIAVAALGLFLMLFVDIVKEKGYGVYSLIQKVPLPVRYFGYGLIFYLVILMGSKGADLTGGFMYAQF